MTSTLTKLGLVNEVLVSIGEREVQSTSINSITRLVSQCIQDALYFVGNNNTWAERREIINASSWVLDKATLPSTTIKVRNVYFYHSPDGEGESNYDYQRTPVTYVDLEEYLTQSLVPFSDADNHADLWTIESRNVLRVNPYPTNTLARSLVLFEVFSSVALPSTDNSHFDCSDLYLNIVKWKACEILAIKHLSDFDMGQYFSVTYEMLSKHQRISDSSQGTKGYTMYRRRKDRRW